MINTLGGGLVEKGKLKKGRGERGKGKGEGEGGKSLKKGYMARFYQRIIHTAILNYSNGCVNPLERDFIRMRQREGIELAKKEGKFKGRLKKYHKNHAGMEICSKTI